MSDIQVRTATVEDVIPLLNVQSQTYSASFHEDQHTFRSILDQSMSFIALSTDTNNPVGYILIHGLTSLQDPPYLNQPIARDKVVSNLLFIHDLCILPQHQGKGYGSFLWKYALKHLVTHTHIHPMIACISLPQSITFWKKQGFEDMSCDKSIINSYGPGACYLYRYRSTPCT